MYVCKTEKQAAFPIKIFYDIKGWKLSWRRLGR